MLEAKRPASAGRPDFPAVWSEASPSAGWREVYRAMGVDTDV